MITGPELFRRWKVGDERSSFRLRMMRLSSDDGFACMSDEALALIGCRTELEAAGTSGSREANHPRVQDRP
jgi:hypothetical protein